MLNDLKELKESAKRYEDFYPHVLNKFHKYDFANIAKYTGKRYDFVWGFVDVPVEGESNYLPIINGGVRDICEDGLTTQDALNEEAIMIFGSNFDEENPNNNNLNNLLNMLDDISKIDIMNISIEDRVRLINTISILDYNVKTYLFSKYILQNNLTQEEIDDLKLQYDDTPALKLLKDFEANTVSSLAETILSITGVEVEASKQSNK